MFTTALVLTLVASAEETTPGKWVSASGAEPTLTLPAETTVDVPARVFRLQDMGRNESVVPKLLIRCWDRKPRVALDGLILASSEVTLRFDQDPPQTLVLEQLSRREKGFVNLLMDSKTVEPGYFFSKPVEIVAALLAHRQVLMRLTPTGRPSAEVVFEPGGLEALLAAFEQGCGLERPFARPAVAPTRSAAPAAAAPAEPEVEHFGKWEVNRSVSRLDDRAVVLLSLTSDTKVKAEGESALEPILVMRCREKAPEAYVFFGRYALPAARYGYGDLVVQASAEGDKTTEWALSPSTDRRSFFFESAPALLKRLLASRRLRLEFGPRKRKEWHSWMPEGAATFDVSALDQASRSFLEACPTDFARVKVKDGLGPLP